MKQSTFNNDLVKKVSVFLQDYMKSNNISRMKADECAELLAKNLILPNDVGPKQGFNFREMLRNGRDNKIELVTGAYQQKPKTKWTIFKV